MHRSTPTLKHHDIRPYSLSINRRDPPVQARTKFIQTKRRMDEVEAEIKGSRATKLDTIIDRALTKTLSACRYEKLVSCFPTLAHTDAETLRHAQEQVSHFLHDSCKKHFDSILEDRQVVQRLNEFDTLIEDAKRRKEAGEPATENPSEMSPETIMKAHILPLKRTELANLNAMILELQQENAVKLSAIEEQRQQVEARMRALKESLSTFDSTRKKSTQRQQQ